MTTFRIVKDKNNPFVMVNKNLIHDSALSYKAKGILIYLLSKPNDWHVYETEITKHSRDGLKAVRSGIKELIKQGYIHRIRTRSKHGKFTGWQYFVYEEPCESTVPTEVPKTEDGKRHITNINNTNTENELPVRNWIESKTGYKMPDERWDVIRHKAAK
jgi:hypothetical protein